MADYPPHGLLDWDDDLKAYIDGQDALVSGEIPGAVEDAVEAYQPGTTAAYAKVETSLTFTSATYPGVFIPGLTTGPVLSNGRPMDIELRVPFVAHTVANANITFQLVADVTLGPLNLLQSVPLAIAGKANSARLTREVTVPAGQSKTWSVFAYADVAGTTTLTAATYCPIELLVIRR